MIKCTLYKAILKSRNTPVITLSIAMVGIYVGYLTWYIVNRYLPEPISSYRVLVAILTFWICAFVAIYKIPDQLFTNRRIKDVLCFPVSVDKLVSLVIGRLACFQFGMVVCGFWAYFLYASDDWLLTITILLGYGYLLRVFFIHVRRTKEYRYYGGHTRIVEKNIGWKIRMIEMRLKRDSKNNENLIRR